MLDKVRAVVLRVLKYGDSNRIVDMYTDTVGRSSYIIRYARNSRQRGAGGTLYMPLSLVEFESCSVKQGRLSKVTEAKQLYPLSAIQFSPVKSSIALFLSEFLCYALREERESASLFAYLVYSIRWLNDCREEQASNFHLVFLMRLSRFLGVYPNLDGYGAGCYFDLVDAAFVETCPTHTAYLAPAEAAYVKILMRMNYETMHLFAFSRVQRVRCLEVLNQFYSLHIPNFPLLKSLGILRELFD